MKLKDYPAVLLSDNCPSHRCEEIYKELANHNIRLITFPPHTTNLFQPLDLVTFSSFKLEKAMVNSKYKKRSQSDMFYRNLVAMEKATTSSKCNISSFSSPLLPCTSTFTLRFLESSKIARSTMDI